jgi:hypothetical protein
MDIQAQAAFGVKQYRKENSSLKCDDGRKASRRREKQKKRGRRSLTESNRGRRWWMTQRDRTKRKKKELSRHLRDWFMCWSRKE